MHFCVLLAGPYVLLIVVPRFVIAGALLSTGLHAVDPLSRQRMNDISARVGQMAAYQLEEAPVTMRATFPNESNNHDVSLDVFTAPIVKSNFVVKSLQTMG